MKASDHRSIARQALSGHWPMAVLVGFVAALLGGSTGVGGSGGSGGSGSSGGSGANMEEVLHSFRDIPEEVIGILLGIIGAVGLLGLIWAVVMLVLGSAMDLGYARYNLNLVDAGPAQFGDLFACFGQLWNAVLLRFLTGLVVFLGTLLFVFPGIIAAFSFAMAPYIMAEDPQCTALEAMRRSSDMMDGYRVELFCLKFSFIGWLFLGMITFGIGNLFVRPYYSAAHAVFYRNLQHRTRREYDPPVEN